MLPILIQAPLFREGQDGEPAFSGMHVADATLLGEVDLSERVEVPAVERIEDTIHDDASEAVRPAGAPRDEPSGYRNMLGMVRLPHS
jgi:hypothetical protein